jgi:hypothetical protein
MPKRDKDANTEVTAALARMKITIKLLRKAADVSILVLGLRARQ